MNVHAIVYYYIEGNKVINIGCFKICFKKGNLVVTLEK